MTEEEKDRETADDLSSVDPRDGDAEQSPDSQSANDKKDQGETIFSADILPADQQETRSIKPPDDHIQAAETISLLDLMDEVKNDSPPIESVGSNEKQAPYSDDIDEATPTGMPIPSELPPSGSPPPLIEPDLTPIEKPAVSDQEATQVQPRSAFPGQTQLHGPPDQSITEIETKQEQAAPDNSVRRGSVPPAPSRAEQPTRLMPRRSPVRAAVPVRSTETASQPQELLFSQQKRRWSGCISRLFVVGVLLFFIALALGVAGASFGYLAIASQLPLPSELRDRASSFETAQILDRNGRVLYSLADPTTGNRSFVQLDRIDQDLQNATIATEDARFYSNPGFDPIAIVRAIYQAALEGEIVSGASTITQQLARALLLDEDERTQQTFSRKVKEIVLAAELFRTYPKEEILELYLNEIYYGNRAYGIEAAAQTYFRKPAEELNLAEASLLAGLPQAPALWDPYTAPDKALGRQREVLALMISEGFITAAEAQDAISETQDFIDSLEPPDVTIRYPHFSITVLQQLEEAIGAQAIYRGGLRIFTTLDPAVQQLAEDTISSARGDINAAGANNASMVVLEPGSGEILALIGSLDFNDESIDGQVNMALAPRQPGSTIKPLVYLSAMEAGWTPSTLLWDVETQFPDGTNPAYVPKNYDDQFHGPLRLRPALGNSYNIPAVKALEYVGVCNFIDQAARLGLRLEDIGCQESGFPRDHGLSLALGGGEISAVDMAGAYGVLANNGRFEAPFAISRIEDRSGNLVFEHEPANPNSSQVVKAEDAFLISDILADNNARQPEFGPTNNLNIDGHRAAAKTGTSGADRFSVRDGWTIGYTPEVVAAVWVGNTDNQPVGEGQNGYQMASPIWHSFMSQYLAGSPPTNFSRPQNIVEAEVCSDSGAIPGPGCRQAIPELYANDKPPDGIDKDLTKPVDVDVWTSLEANEFCQESIFKSNFFNLVANGNEEVIIREQVNARKWLEETAAGQRWAAQRDVEIPLKLPPTQSCDADTLRPQVNIISPTTMESLTDVVDITGTALGPNFNGFALDYGLSFDPQGWAPIQLTSDRAIENGLLGRWDLAGIAGGPASIRLTLIGPDNPFTPIADPVTMIIVVPVNVVEPTPTPSPTVTSSPTPTPTETPTPTGTPSPTASPSPTETSTPASNPSETPVTPPTDSPAGTPEPTVESTPSQGTSP